MNDLEKKINKYCRSVYPHWSDSEEKVEELKDHLYCEIERLKKTGLPDEQAFAEAARHLGNIDELKKENAKDKNIKSMLFSLFDWRLPMNPKKAAILHIGAALIFAFLIMIGDSIVEQTQYAHHSEDVRNIILAIYMAPFCYLCSAEQKHMSCICRFSIVKQKVAGLFNRK